MVTGFVADYASELEIIAYSPHMHKDRRISIVLSCPPKYSLHAHKDRVLHAAHVKKSPEAKCSLRAHKDRAQKNLAFRRRSPSVHNRMNRRISCAQKDVTRDMRHRKYRHRHLIP